MINRVTLVGNLGRDPELRKLDNGVSIARFSIATNENYRDKAGNWQTNTEWHNIVCWRGLADGVEARFKKGHLVYIEGKLTHSKYKDKDGNDRNATEILASTCRLLEKRDATQRDAAPMPNAETPTSDSSPSTGIDGSDLPF
jgi:single-strand DNA-binding protein